MNRFAFRLSLVLTALLVVCGPLAGRLRADEPGIPLPELNAALVRRVRQFVAEEPSLAALVVGLKVTASGGKVTLRGTCKSKSDKIRFEKRAREITGQKLDDQLDTPG